jgi:hypothetical protein
MDVKTGSNGRMKNLHNKELQNFFSQLSIIKLSKLKGMEWQGMSHTWQIWGGSAYSVFIRITERKIFLTSTQMER